MRAFLGSIACGVLVAACGFSGKSDVQPDGGSIDTPDVTSVAFAPDATSVMEGSAATVTVRLSRASTTEVDATVAVTGGTASAADYQLVTTSLAFAPGETEKQVTLNAIFDGLLEPDETVELTLSAPTGGAVLGADATHVVTILASAAPTVRFTTATSEGDETQNTDVAISWDFPSPQAMSFSYTVTGTAISGTDEMLMSGTYNIPANAGFLGTDLFIQPILDGLDEDDETVIITITGSTNMSIDGAHAIHTHTIHDIDPSPSVTIAPPAVKITEASGTATLTVTLSAVSGRAVTVPFGADAASTATEGVDFSYSTATPIVIPAGTQSMPITVAIVNDTIYDPDEVVKTALGTPTNATLGATTTASFTIVDDDPICYGQGNYAVCLAAPPSGAGLSLNGSINTDTDGRCLASQPVMWTANGEPDACFITGSSLNIGNITVTGTRPLVLLAATTITLTGTLDASSHRGGSSGPGSFSAASASCPAFAHVAASNNNGGGGGAGGSFMTIGGGGGKGNSGAVLAGVAGAALTNSPTVLRGGCFGQAGGDGNTGAMERAGSRGRGGGVVYLVAGTSMTISGVVNASGAAGAGGDQHTGGSGGGSGGMIVLDAPAISLSGTIFANGGGASGGGDNNSNGLDGTDGGFASAPGGTGTGGAGGAGFFGTSAAVTGTQGGNNSGGGGGGGGGGYLKSSVALPAANVSAGKIE